MSKQQRREKKRGMFRAQKGRCFYCNRIMKLLFGISGGKLEDDFATIEHLDHKFSERRNTFKRTARTVLACYKCNNEKGNRDEQNGDYNQRKYFETDPEPKNWIELPPD